MSHAPLIAVVLVCEVLIFSGIFAFPALAPTFIDRWALSYAQAGWVSGIYFAGYVTSVLTLVRLTERVDARLVFAASALLMSAASLGFAFLADGFWSALVLRFLGGIGFAGTYMPGLRALLDRIAPSRHRLVVTLYMAGGALGHGMSFLVAGEVGAAWGWRGVFLATGAAAAMAAVLMLACLRAVPKAATHSTASSATGLAGVFRNRRALGYVLAYGAHNWEVYTVNSWVVALLVFNLGAQQDLAPWLTPTTVATTIGVLAIPAILGGGALAQRFGDRVVCSRVMLLSTLFACTVGALATAPYELLAGLVLLYTFALYADSPGLTSGAIAASRRGQTADVMALHTLVGHLTAAAGPPAFGLVLDLAGGGSRAQAWTVAFASMALVVALGPLCLRGRIRTRVPRSRGEQRRDRAH